MTIEIAKRLPPRETLGAAVGPDPVDERQMAKLLRVTTPAGCAYRALEPVGVIIVPAQNPRARS